MFYNNNRIIFNGICFVKLVLLLFNLIFICFYLWKFVKEFFNFYFIEYRIFLNVVFGLSYIMILLYIIFVICLDNYGMSVVVLLIVNVVVNIGFVIFGFFIFVFVIESDIGGSSIYILIVIDLDFYICFI